VLRAFFTCVLTWMFFYARMFERFIISWVELELYGVLSFIWEWRCVQNGTGSIEKRKIYGTSSISLSFSHWMIQELSFLFNFVFNIYYISGQHILFYKSSFYFPTNKIKFLNECSCICPSNWHGFSWVVKKQIGKQHVFGAVLRIFLITSITYKVHF